MTTRATDAWRWAVAPLRDRATWAGGAVLVAGAVPALAVLALVATGFVVGTALVPVGVGVPVLVGALVVVRGTAELDRRLLAAALGADADLDVDRAADRSDQDGGWTTRARALVTDARTWRSTAWLSVRSGAGLLAVLGLLLTAVVAVALLAVPFVDGYLAFGSRWESSAGWSSAWTLPVAVVLLLGVAHGVRLLTAAHARLAEVLLGADPAERIAALQTALDRADSRERIARDLHDGLGHALTLVVVQAEAAGTALTADPDAARVRLDAVTAAARQALGDLDRALDALHGAPPTDPVLDDVPDLVRAARAAGLDVTADVAPTGGLDAAVSAAAYRVVQEGLTNALRHNRSRQAVVSVRRDVDGVRVVIRTPGTRSRVFGGGSGRGLDGVRERVTVSGGALVAGPRTDEFVVEAVWPNA